MTAAIEVASKAAVKIVVNAVSGGSSGGGVSAHSALTGLTTGDDHPQYQRSESTFTSASSFTITDESTVVSTGSTVILPDAQSNSGRTVLVGAGADVTVTRAGTDVFLDGVGSTTFLVRSGNGVGFTSVNAGGTWGWAIVTRQGTSYDLPAWAGLSIPAGQYVRMGASAPAWSAVQASDLGTGTADANHFLAGDLTWQDAVPLDVACKNTTASTIAKGTPVYVTGSVGAGTTVEIAPADAASSGTMPAIGLTTASLTANATGYVRVMGVLSGLNTSGYTINGTTFVASGGGLTGTRPTGSTVLVQNIGRVIRVNGSTGEILVLGPGRSNDVPNLIGTGYLATSGTASSSTFLRGDQTWSGVAAANVSGLATIATSGSATDLSAGTVPSARLATKVVGGQDEGAGVALTATPASLLDATIALPACAAGDLVLVAGSFTILNNSTASRNYAINMKVGSTNIASATAVAIGNATTRSVMFQMYLRVEGTSDLNATAMFATSVGGAASNVHNAAGVATENIGTGSLAFDLTISSSTGTATQTGTLESITVTRIAA